ncbi:hypothetical protein N9C33_01380 [Crocinitomicaceae bacterium]|nr:hypothetical protein [Crocinitomicaceae bacterium]
MTNFNNFKEHWLNFFNDSSKFRVEIITEDTDIETILISSAAPSNQTTIELIMYNEDGEYQSMFDIRFHHPDHFGFNKLQRLRKSGFKANQGEFNSITIERMENTINYYLKNGLSETIYSYNGSHFKSEITEWINGRADTFTWTEKEHMMSNKYQRFFNRSFIKSYSIHTGKWI